MSAGEQSAPVAATREAPLGRWCIVREQPPRRGKTRVWAVLSSEARFLGEIRWWNAWRRYSFFPGASTLYEPECLRAIADFLEARTAEQRELARAAREARP